MWTKSDRDRPDQVVARLAAGQHGVVTRRQLLEAGLLSSGIAVRLKAGRLHRVHRGVYAVGYSNLGNEGRWTAAVLACGDGAVLSHLSAARLWNLDPRARRRSGARGGGTDGWVDVTVPVTRGKRRRSGIVLHRSSTLTASDCVRHDGITVTSPARTIEDLRRTLPSQLFASMLREAEFLGLAIGDGAPTDHTRSALEAKFLALLRRHRFPRPEVNARVDRFVVDFLWPPQRLIVELDGWEGHRGRLAFEQDRSRDARLKLLGFDVLRFTWLQITKSPREVLSTLHALLAVR